IFFSLLELSPSQVPTSERQVATGIPGITTQRFSPVEIRLARRVAVLFQMQTGDEQLVRTGDLFRQQGLRSCGRELARGDYGWGVMNNLTAIDGEHSERKIRRI